MRYHLLLFRERVGENPMSPKRCSTARPGAYVERMARAKRGPLARMLQRTSAAPVLAADTR